MSRTIVSCRFGVNSAPLPSVRRQPPVPQGGTNLLFKGTRLRSTCHYFPSLAAYGLLKAAVAGTASVYIVKTMVSRRRTRQQHRRLSSDSQIQIAKGIRKDLPPSLSLLPRRYAESRVPLQLLDDASKLDPYAILRVPFLSGPRSIRDAFVRLCKVEHPDVHQGRISMEWLMGEWAYRILTDPGSRARYDTSRVLRNMFSVTEGVVAFGFAAAKQFGSFVVDAVEVSSRVISQLVDDTRLLSPKSPATSEESVEAVAAVLDAAEIRLEEAERKLEILKEVPSRITSEVEAVSQVNQQA